MEIKKRLSKALAAAGIASRRAAEELIFEGRVTVNGEKILVPQTLVCLKKDTVCVDEVRVRSEERKAYFLLNKPHGYICSNTRIGTKKLVIDLFSAEDLRLFSVGRLDRDTTGLLIVTNDGHFAQKVIHPSARVQKEYLVKCAQEITHDHLRTISEGMYIENGWVKPVKVTKVRKGTIKVIVMEGKKREVRLLVQKAQLDILELSRIRIGNLRLGPLPIGTYRELTEAEKTALLHSSPPKKARP
jgi:23S rRNA pseudouridine2605 synthase